MNCLRGFCSFGGELWVAFCHPFSLDLAEEKRGGLSPPYEGPSSRDRGQRGKDSNYIWVKFPLKI